MIYSLTPVDVARGTAAHACAEILSVMGVVIIKTNETRGVMLRYRLRRYWGRDTFNEAVFAFASGGEDAVMRWFASESDRRHRVKSGAAKGIRQQRSLF